MWWGHNLSQTVDVVSTVFDTGDKILHVQMCAGVFASVFSDAQRNER